MQLASRASAGLGKKLLAIECADRDRPGNLFGMPIIGAGVETELAERREAALNVEAGWAISGAKPISEAVWRYSG